MRPIDVFRDYGMRKQVALFLAVAFGGFVFTQCTSTPKKEEKALALINDHMFKTLYYYDSYQPLETRIDSAIHTPFNDTMIMKYALKIKGLKKKSAQYDEQHKRALDMLTVIGGERYHREFMNIGDSLLSTIRQSIMYDDSIRLLGRRITPDFMGWDVTHKYSYKTKSGTIDTASQVFVVDGDLTKIINIMNVESEDYDECQRIIKNILERQ